MTTPPQTPQLDAVNPFPGLRPFEPSEAPLFFGREKQTEELVRLLRQTRFVAVVGSSGSGKSSLVRAGLIPALQTGSAWRIALSRPGDKPIQNLALALYSDAQLGTSGADPNIELGMVETILRGSSAGLSALVQQSRFRDGENLLVVVDQFEELFRYRSSDQSAYAETAAAFIKLLLAAASDAALPIYVVITMRADFIGNCASYPGLPKAVSDGQFLVPYPSRQELRRAIVEPAAAVHCEIAPRLVVRLLNEAGEDPDQLPVLQHAMMRSWDYWQRHREPGEPLDFRHYEAIGTMRGALSEHADEAYAELSSPVEQRIAEKAFRALVETDEQGRVVRRPTTLSQIAAIAGEPESSVRAVIERFSAPSRAFVIFRSDSFLDLSHESLIRIWTRLRDWAAAEAQAAGLYRRLSRSAELHAKGEESLWVNPQLALARKWRAEIKPNSAWAERYAPDLDRSIAFLDDSRKAYRRRAGFGIAAVASFIVLLAVLAAVTVIANHRLRRDKSALEGQVKGLRNQHVESGNQVASLSTRQASLTKQLAGLTASSQLLVSQVKSLQAEGDSLSDQVQSAAEARDSALEKVAKVIGANGGSAGEVLNLAAKNDESVAALIDLNAQNRSLMTRIVELGIKLPPKAPAQAMQFPAVAAGSSAMPPPRAVLARSNASVSSIAVNANLVAEADRLTRENQDLGQQADALRRQNEKLADAVASLREQVAQLNGEKTLLSSLNSLRKQEIEDSRAVAAKLSADASNAAAESGMLQQIDSKLTLTLGNVDLQRQNLLLLNSALSNAIRAAQPKK